MKNSILFLALMVFFAISTNAQTYLLGKNLSNIKDNFLGETDIRSKDYPSSIELSIWNTSSGDSYTFQIDKKNNCCYSLVFWPGGGDSGRMKYIKSLNENLGMVKDGNWYTKHSMDGRIVKIHYSVQMGLGGQFEFSYK